MQLRFGNSLLKLRKIIFAIAIALLAIMIPLVFSSGQFEPVNKIYVFGDSLSDMGAVFRATGGMYPPSPAYFQGRYSNGRVWVEYLAERLKIKSSHVNNFACGGATSGSESNTFVPGLLTQVQSFTQKHPRTIPNNALYVLWAGANDYLHSCKQCNCPG